MAADAPNGGGKQLTRINLWISTVAVIVTTVTGLIIGYGTAKSASGAQQDQILNLQKENDYLKANSVTKDQFNQYVQSQTQLLQSLREELANWRRQ